MRFSYFSMRFASTWVVLPTLVVRVQLANIALSALFAAEMLIKHLALGFYRYWRNGFNALDGAIVISSILEIILMASTQHSESSGLRAFRLIRIFRTIKLLRQFKGLHRLLSTVIKVCPASCYCSTKLLMLLCGISAFSYQGLVDELEHRSGMRFGTLWLSWSKSCMGVDHA